MGTRMLPLQDSCPRAPTREERYAVLLLILDSDNSSQEGQVPFLHGTNVRILRHITALPHITRGTLLAASH